MNKIYKKAKREMHSLEMHGIANHPCPEAGHGESSNLILKKDYYSICDG